MLPVLLQLETMLLGKSATFICVTLDEVVNLKEVILTDFMIYVFSLAGSALGPTTQSGSITACDSCLSGYYSSTPATECSKCVIGDASCSSPSATATSCSAGYGFNTGIQCVSGTVIPFRYVFPNGRGKLRSFSR